jgi:hypothetical protein
MAQEQEPQQGQRPSTNSQFTKGLNKDLTDTVLPAGAYTHARNATPILPDGQTGLCLHTEPANVLETVIPYTLIGRIQLEGDQWILFSTNNTYSEIGLYLEGQHVYTTLLNDVATITAGLPGLNFSTSNLITGAARRNFDCGFDVYWSDGRRNPDRMLDTQYLYPNPWVQDCNPSTTDPLCIICTNTNKIDINQLRLAPQYSIPCLSLSKSSNSGLLLNGSYQICLRFAINGIACTDFVALSNVMGIFSHNNQAGALTLSISGISAETTVIYPEVEIVVVSMVNFQVQAKRLGIYNSNQSTIHIDNLADELVNIDLKLLPLSTPIIDSSDAIYSINNYLIRCGVAEKPEFNYQPLANQIIANWACIEYPDDYYHKGGQNGYPMNVGYLRDEVYSLYIRWVYTTGDKSASYHIPGLPGGTSATITSIPFTTLPDGGTLVATGRFAGYSSQESYPDNEPEIWTDLCGLPVMHHKFPDQTLSPGLTHFTAGGDIRIMGIFLTNILAPVDNNGNIIPNIQGYEILRDVRNGNESVLAKGMINNMRTYTDAVGNTGLFSNYPYNDLAPDPYLTNDTASFNTGHAGWGGSGVPYLSGYRNDIMSFHSPDTVFQHPYLGSGDPTLPPDQTVHLKVIMGMTGTSYGQFVQPYKHPLFKVLTDFDSAIADFIGALLLIQDIVQAFIIAGGGNPPNWEFASTESLPMTTPVFTPPLPNLDVDGTDLNTALQYIIAGLNIATLILLSAIQVAAIREQILNIIKGMIPGRQYAVQFNSHGLYDTPVAVGTGGSVYGITDYSYVRGQEQEFQDMTVNNIYRNNYVILQLDSLTDPTLSLTTDHSRYTLGEYGHLNPNVVLSINQNTFQPSTIGSLYAAYIVPQFAQYGQVGSCKQVPIGCMQPVNIPPTPAPFTYTSSVQFGGDTYINRYTEKNPMMFFNDWLVNVPEDFIYDYRNYANVPYPIYWINNDVITYTLLGLASKNRRLDGPLNTFSGAFFPGMSGNAFYVDTGYFYLFNNGVRDFYVESSVNVGYRDYGELIQEQFYNPYGLTTDINQIFRSDIIKSDPVYKYDYSLSADKFFNQYLSWSQCLDRDYNPILAYSCNAYYPRRLAYSLPQEEEIKKDNWKVFLPNNYKDMVTTVTAIKSTSKTGALILLNDQAPLSFTGIEQISSSNGTNYTVGNGNLFDQPLQQVTNVDGSYQYGSCQNRLSIISTPYGVMWASQNTGKIFHYAPSKTYYNKGEAIIDITTKGLKYWMARYMPSQLLLQFPTYPLYDNPVAGVGMQLIYDNVTDLVYICKKDWQLLPQYVGLVYLSGNNFYYASPFGKLLITLGDPTYFTNCSWTVSYDPDKQQFVSFHDWFPAMNIQAKNHFLTTDTIYGTGNILWRHNTAVNLFCNYYGQQFPFEIEYPVITGSNVTILESIEVFLEAYLYNSDKIDKFHNYGDFFDYCLVYNSEQSTQPMLMVLKPWDDPGAAQAYPIQTAAGISTYYTKQEQRYRIAMGLRDFTADRGEFTLDTTQLFLTNPNGYTWNITPGYLDISKNPLQLKKIRHFKSRIFLRKINPGNLSMSIYFTAQKLLQSPR